MPLVTVSTGTAPYGLDNMFVMFIYYCASGNNCEQYHITEKGNILTLSLCSGQKKVRYFHTYLRDNLVGSALSEKWW